MSEKYVTQSSSKDVAVRVSGDACRDGRVRTDILVCDKGSKTHAHYSADGKTGKVTKHHDLRR